MSTVDILLEIKRLPVSEQRMVVEEALRAIRLEERRVQMRAAADRLHNDYKTDTELIAFTALDGEPVYESV